MFPGEGNLGIENLAVKRGTNQTLLFCVLRDKRKKNYYSLFPSLFPQAIRSLRSEADWQEILKKVKEEEEESSVPTDLFKVV